MGVVTKVEVCKKNKNRVNIFVDGEFFMSSFLEVCYLNKIKAGLEINEANLKQIILAEEIAKAESYAIKLLSKFIKTEHEVKQKLTEKGYSSEASSEVISKLKKYGYINDEQFAINYKNANEHTKSKVYIKQHLKQKGISENIISKLKFSSEAELNTAIGLANKWLKNKERSKENMYKLNNFLYGKGFSSDICRRVVSLMSVEHIEDDYL